ncbi:MAG: bifunctional glycosyltransferase family 2 protein/CDP-glycerol:glycerophosphate glycerophosphotransferase [Clostridiales Family XIII bacterium]|jgi:CDP-glycerol glycerophosphotransferase (TagB/SpsB family)|nr:bifunctional glycosyltransferase family 2 protein/CDP-glycerol:glycerophosphate glycerophosphotransferase [Clostridiales Family XIII bacterium]
MQKSPRVSVIIPVYNNEAYLQECLDSVYNQTFDDYEIIIIDDGSTDSTPHIIERNIASAGRNLLSFRQPNTGAGAARNRGINMASGEYLFFLDADDFIEDQAFEILVKHADESGADFVHCHHKFYNDEKKTYSFRLYEKYSCKDELTGGECDEFLRSTYYFSVTNLYRRSFLMEHDIRYKNQKVYEDWIFIVKAVTSAEKISLLSSPLYTARVSPESTTRLYHDSDEHFKGYLSAVKSCLEVFRPRTKDSLGYLISGFIRRFFIYYRVRIPRSLRRRLIKETVDLLQPYEFTMPADERRMMKIFTQKRVIQDRRYFFFFCLVQLYYLLEVLRKSKALVKRLLGKWSMKKNAVSIADMLGRVLYRNPGDVILFFGFDFRYAGNSRYLFDAMVHDERFAGKKIFFATNDTSVDKAQRVSPRSIKLIALIRSANLLIAESWIPQLFKKPEGATWLQLWHGTPLKKMLFDSNETDIVEINHAHKRVNYANILRWDYMIADSAAAARIFRTSFLIAKDKLLQTGYPRVKWLIEHKDDVRLKESIRNRLGFGDKPVVLYAPTWRDYNYGKTAEESDFGYSLDLTGLAGELGNEYIVAYKDHEYLTKLPIRGCRDVSDCEIEELLLIADYLITDYSSVLFDAFPIDLPVILYASDFDRFQNSRGVYENIWDDLHGFIENDVPGIASRIAKYEPGAAYREFRNTYCYDPKIDVVDFILKHTCEEHAL